MSKLTDLKKLQKNNLNLVEPFKCLCSEKKTKYVELLLSLITNGENFINTVNYSKEELFDNFKIPKDSFSNLTDFELMYFWSFFRQVVSFDDVRNFNKFCTLNEKGLIEQNDITKYNSFQDIQKSLGMVEFKLIEKTLKTQIDRIFEDDEWLVLRPLTYLASQKYGAGTKWCTASETYPDTFHDYSKNGILIYTINKKTCMKVASYYQFNGKDLTFWNQIDNRVDSMMSGLPVSIITLIVENILTNHVSNFSMLDEETRNTEEKMIKDLNEKRRNDSQIDEPLATMGITAPRYVTNTTQEAMNEEVEQDEHPTQG